MSTRPAPDVEVAIVGAGVIGCAAALALARREVEVALLEAEPEPGLGASGTNSGVLHTGFDSVPGELETEMILDAGRLRPAVTEALQIPVLRCGALMRPQDAAQRQTIGGVAANARQNGVTVVERTDGTLEIPGEAVTDPVHFTLALAGGAQQAGAEIRTGWRVSGAQSLTDGIELSCADADSIRCRVMVNCAGLEADAVARLAGDESFQIYPRKGEFLVFEPPDGRPLERILLPIPTKRTKGVLVFPTLDGKVVAGPTAVDQEDKRDWLVRPQAREAILPTARAAYPALEDAEPIFSYAGLRPAGRGVNYVIAPSTASPRLINVAAIRSTGLTASLGVAQRVCELVASLGVPLRAEKPLQPVPLPPMERPWWRRTAEHMLAV